MKNSNVTLIERMVREMQYCNYSERSIRSYTASMSKVQNFYQLPIDKITSRQFKDYLYHRIMEDKIPVSMINQCISALKIMQQDVPGRQWEPIRIKHPRQDKKLPVELQKEEVDNF